MIYSRSIIWVFGLLKAFQLESNFSPWFMFLVPFRCARGFHSALVVGIFFIGKKNLKVTCYFILLVLCLSNLLCFLYLCLKQWRKNYERKYWEEDSPFCRKSQSLPCLFQLHVRWDFLSLDIFSLLSSFLGDWWLCHRS